ncbi:hypothetical protein TeGR_g12020 [Tetraparma gracilis]|uniref:Uncharacterized protein n=1 Tax=Tetraparma gracilis TaxID=2962635 RepID=A0ABQ6N6E8_9STRA|nr:hypothetical protein TeGR_g12020 [Tetraparma gracilis]
MPHIVLLLASALGLSAAQPDAVIQNIYPTTIAPGDEDFSCGPETNTTTDGGTDVHITNVSVPTLTLQQAGDSPSSTAVIVMPGGGYEILSYIKEGEAICEYLNELEIDCFLLKYRVPARPDEEGMPWSWAPLMDIQRSMGLARSNANNYKKVGAMGFSAGGHLTTHVSTTGWQERLYAPIDGSDKESARPDFSVLIYPAYLTPDGPTTTNVAEEVVPDKDTPPTFSVQTQDDGFLSALGFYVNCTSVGVPAEMHLFAEGGHGYGMCDDDSNALCEWPERLASWLQTQI